MAVPGPSPLNSSSLNSSIDLGKDKSNFFQQRSGRNRNFTHRENVELIRIWGDSQIQRKFETSYRNSGLWESIAEQMQDAGFNRSPLECKTRVANLKAQFFKLKRGIRPGSSPPDWPYFEMLQAIIDGGKGPSHYPYEQNSGGDVLESMEYGEYEFKRVGNPVQNGAYAALNFPNSSNIDSSSHDSYLESESNTFHNNSSRGENELQIDLSRGARNRNFSHEETLYLLDIWGNATMQRSFESPYLNSKLWEVIANKMLKAGYKRSVIECKTKVTNLKCQYYKLKRQTQPGENPPDWPYWDKLHSIMQQPGRMKTKRKFSEATTNGPSFLSQYSNGEDQLTTDLDLYQDQGNHLSQSNAGMENGEHDSDCASSELEDHQETPRKKKKHKVDDLIMYKLLDIERRSLKLQEERNEDERRMFKAVADFFNAMTGLITGQMEDTSEGASSSSEPKVAPTLSETMMSVVDCLHSARKKAAAAAAGQSGPAPTIDDPQSPRTSTNAACASTVKAESGLD